MYKYKYLYVTKIKIKRYKKTGFMGRFFMNIKNIYFTVFI